MIKGGIPENLLCGRERPADVLRYAEPCSVVVFFAPRIKTSCLNCILTKDKPNTFSKGRFYYPRTNMKNPELTAQNARINLHVCEHNDNTMLDIQSNGAALAPAHAPNS